MKHVHHDMIVEWAKDTSRVVEIRGMDGTWRETIAPTWGTQSEYRFKPAEPKFITVNGIQVPEPVREPLERGQTFWLADANSAAACSLLWLGGSEHTARYLSLGLIHLTKEAAQAHIDAMLLPSRSDK